jgi:hypothetical protein
MQNSYNRMSSAMGQSLSPNLPGSGQGPLASYTACTATWCCHTDWQVINGQTVYQTFCWPRNTHLVLSTTTS